MVSCSECHIFGLALFGIVKAFTIHVILYLLNFVFLKIQQYIFNEKNS
jgi:hypothetical protein